MSKVKNCETVKVVVRCRPLNRKEEAAGHEQIVNMDVKLGQVTVRNPKAAPGELLKTFTFDAVYDASSKQSDLYDETVRPLIDSVLQGFNGTIFAYGQTGTGKTYTMQGAWMDPEKRGIIPNSFEHIFTHISRSQNQQYLVRASYLEIYQEEIRDLLCKDQSRKPELKENPDSGVYIKDLSSFVTKNVKEIEHVMNVGNQARSIGFTNMNEHSSRSHAIFVITIECSETGIDSENHIRVGKLNLVDLAGSERQSKTGVQGERLKEATKINLSLSALGNVVSALVDGKSTHIPYRDSKLTRLLQDSLGGNAKTIMVATLGPASYNYEESLTTLRYANRAKNIKNKPRVNEDPKDALLREFQEEIARLKTQLEKRGVLTKKRRRNSRRIKKMLDGEEVTDLEGEDETEHSVEKDMEDYLKEQENLELEKAAILDDRSLVADEKHKLLDEKERMMDDLRREQEATEMLTAKFKNVKEIEHVMNVGNQARSIGFTNMNEHSSRSHAIFVITVECSETGIDSENHIRVGKLNLVDLAGSERQSKTGVRGERLKEATKINLSLSALGNVVSALVDGKSTHIPYRDSKLTRLLQDSLGGNAKTIMVATLGPASYNYEESLTTLRYANRAKNIKNKPRVNEDPKDALLREFQEEIARLKTQLEKRGVLTKKRRRNSRRIKKMLDGEEVTDLEGEDETEHSVEKDMEDYLKEQENLELEKAAILDDRSLVADEKHKLLDEKERMMDDLRREQEATEVLTAKFKHILWKCP
ncbi:UNVERIFIED_CONTAM: hypothetical protein FKN15_035612 [Acipenser sinensis]